MPERRAHTESAFVQTFRNLTGVPSYHYDGVFGRIVHEQFASARPAVVALELPASFRPALEWAATCWPTPVAALERGRRADDGHGDAVRAGRLDLRSLSIGLAGRHRGRAHRHRRVGGGRAASGAPRSPSVRSLPRGQARASLAPSMR